MVIVFFNIIIYNLFLCERFNTLVCFRYVLLYNFLLFIVIFVCIFLLCLFLLLCFSHVCYIFVIWFFWLISLVINLLSMCKICIYDRYSGSWF
jgi:hypothetical protein